MIRLALVFILFCACLSVLGQDIIIRTNNDSIRAKIIEVTIDKVKFQYSNPQPGPVLEISKNLVKEIIYADGSKLTIVYDPYSVSSDLFINERKHAIKFDIIAPLLNHFTIGYEVKLKMGKNLGKNLEVKVGIIHPYVWKELNYAEGFFVKAGLKFVRLTDSYLKGLKYIHPLKGAYFKPELIFGSFIRDEDSAKVTYNNIGLNVLFGKQRILWNRVTFDVCGGLGFGFQTYKYKEDSRTIKEEIDFNYAYSHIFFGKSIPIIITGGMTIGFIY
jgi:hypothetical protein